MKRARKTRRSISVTGLTYQRLGKLAKRLDHECLIGRPGLSTTLEYLIAKECDLRGIPEETELRPVVERYPKPGPQSRATHGAGGVFTF